MGCFRDTKCDCSGSPFYSGIGTINISSLFGGTDPQYHKGTVSDLSWITDQMNTSNICAIHYNNGNTADSTTWNYNNN